MAQPAKNVEVAGLSVVAWEPIVRYKSGADVTAAQASSSSIIPHLWHDGIEPRKPSVDISAVPPLQVLQRSVPRTTEWFCPWTLI